MNNTGMFSFSTRNNVDSLNNFDLGLVYRDGAMKASYVAEKTLRKVYKKVGFLAK